MPPKLLAVPSKLPTRKPPSVRPLHSLPNLDPADRAPAALFDRLQAHPEALQAIEALAKLAKEKTGVDLSNGDKPSMAMMLQLAKFVLLV